MEKFKVYVVPDSHTCKSINNPNEKPQTNVLNSMLGAQLALGFSPSLNEAFLVESDSRHYRTYEEFFDAVKTTTAHLGVYYDVNKVLEDVDAKGIWDITRLIVDNTN